MLLYSNSSIMDKHSRMIKEKRIHKAIDALSANNIKSFYAESIDDLLDMVTVITKDDVTASCGGSVTLQETGIITYLENSHLDFIDRRKAGNAEEAREIALKSLTADVYFSGANAITEYGEIYNVDGNGNRTAALIYGPKKVIIVAGYNKIVKNMDAAIERVKRIAAPANVSRLGLDKPCVRMGECANCNEVDKICNVFVTIKFQKDPQRMKVIFLADEFGY